MATSPATSTDLTSRSLRDLTAAEITWGGVQLDDAFAQLVTRIPAVATRLDGNPPATFTRLVVQVQVAMVLRVLANPDYLRQTAIDDSTTILDAAVSSGALYITDAEIALLTASGTGTDGAWSVRPVPATAGSTLPPFTGTMGNIW